MPFYDLALGVPFCHLPCRLWVTRVSPDSVWEGTLPAHASQEARIAEGCLKSWRPQELTQLLAKLQLLKGL